MVLSFCLLLATVCPLTAQDNAVPLKNWPAPLYFQLPATDADTSGKQAELPSVAASDTKPQDRAMADMTAPLVFVGVVPCRVVDTRNANAPLGGPIMGGGSARTFPVLSSSCGLPSAAKAYSFNVTVVPSGALQWLTMWPTGQPQPAVSTLNAYQGQIVANAAVVPSGTSGQIDVFVTNTTHVIIDVNGYYMPPSVLALSAGSASAPALTFNSSNTGVYSPGSGTVSVTSSGTDILTVNSSGISLGGTVGRISGQYGYFHTTNTGYYALQGTSMGSGGTRGVLGTVNSTGGTGGLFSNEAATGKALAAKVNNVEVMTVTEKGVHAGPGMTGTPLAYGTFSAAGAKTAGSSNITCAWQAGNSWYSCTLTEKDGTPIDYVYHQFVPVVTTAGSGLVAPKTDSVGGKMLIYFYNTAGTKVQSIFSVVVYWP